MEEAKRTNRTKQNGRRWFLFKPKRTERVDFMIFMLVLILTGFGLLMLFSASQNTSSKDIYAIIVKQTLCASAGAVAMFVASRIDYHFYRKAAPLFFIGVAVLMYFVPILGFASHGATRQLPLGPFSFQPSELAKFAVVMYFSVLLTSKRYNDITKPKTIMWYGFLLLIMAGACVLQSHLSALIIIVGVGFIMLFAAGLQWKYVFGLGGLAAAGIVLLAIFEPYRLRRIKILFDPFSDPRGDGWQIVNSLYAVGSGGLMGLGFGQSRQKYGYLPEAQNDYIYAVACEELGFFGGIAILLLFGMLILRGIQIAFSSKDAFGMYLAFGIVSIVALQVIVNVGVVLSVLPSTGMQLPFFSSGGTSLIFMMAGMGILMNISRYSTQNKI